MNATSGQQGFLDVKSSDHILEVGCGVGFAVEEILPLVARGNITAIDRSPVAIAKAVHRNAGAIK
jgi:SAM-dependent methyltransferase